MRLPIKTQRLMIDQFTESHLLNPKYKEWLSDLDNLKSLNLISYILNPVDDKILRNYFDSFQNQSNLLFSISLLSDNTFIGTATLREIGYGGLFDLGILIGDKSFRSKGFAREVIGSITDYAFAQMNARKICSSFATDNIGVIIAFIKNGYVIEGLQNCQQLDPEGIAKSRYIVGKCF